MRTLRWFARKTSGFLATSPSRPIATKNRQKTRCRIDRQLAGWVPSFLMASGAAMLIGYVNQMARLRFEFIRFATPQFRHHDGWGRLTRPPSPQSSWRKRR